MINKDLKTPESKRRANKKWDEKNIKKVTVSFNVATDQYLLIYISKFENKSNYFKELIKKDMTEKGLL